MVVGGSIAEVLAEPTMRKMTTPLVIVSIIPRYSHKARTFTIIIRIESN
jgi:hypothetical protein